MHPDDLKAIWICHGCNIKFVFHGDDAVVWAAEAKIAHLIRDLIADTEVAKFNATKK
jgi:hypothetical protein